MLDFKEEIAKYKPLLTIPEIEKSVLDDDTRDILDLLVQIAGQTEQR
ncbi:MAG: hypothetical protein LBU36_04640 [Clostridiales bacterium]|jgi:hypothetical protein|nr:hypothetical protein [Clostridiales bacterium]